MTGKDSEIILLGLETSGLTSGVYLSRDSQMLGEISLNIRNIHSRGVAPFIEQLLQLSGLSLKQISGVVVSAGPGSFTGLRIGYSIAKGLLQVLQKPLIQIPTLDIWVYQQGKTDLPVFSFIDAHRQEIFCAFYHWKGTEMKRDTEYRIVSMNALDGLFHQKTILVGPEVNRFLPQFQELLGEKVISCFPVQEQVQGWALLQLGYQKFISGEYSDINSCEPLYLRPFKGIL